MENIWEGPTRHTTRRPSRMQISCGVFGFPHWPWAKASSQSALSLSLPGPEGGETPEECTLSREGGWPGSGP